jgi:uncharacterized membrane protein
VHYGKPAPVWLLDYLYGLRRIFLYLMALFYVAAGINHFLNPSMYLTIMPPWLPAQPFFVLFSGLAELVLGLLLLVPKTRRLAAWGVILLLIAVFPANIQMALNYRREDAPQLWMAVFRLPVQLLLIWWSYQYTKVLDSDKEVRQKTY